MGLYNKIISACRNGTPVYYHYDGIGAVTGLTDLNGKLLQSYSYDAFGNALMTQGQGKGAKNIVNPYGFSTKEYNPKSGLSYFGARYYDPAVGRFISKDLLSGNIYNPLSINKYPYVENNPVNLIDPLGLCAGKVKHDPITGNIDWAYYEELYEQGQYDQIPKSILAELGGVIPVDAPWEYLPVCGGIAKVGITGLKKISITGYTRHGLNQAISREGVGVAPKAILDAVRNPIRTVQQTGGRIKYIGKDAVVILNEKGRVITTWARNRLGFRNTPEGGI